MPTAPDGKNVPEYEAMDHGDGLANKYGEVDEHTYEEIGTYEIVGRGELKRNEIHTTAFAVTPNEAY